MTGREGFGAWPLVIVAAVGVRGCCKDDLLAGAEEDDAEAATLSRTAVKLDRGELEVAVVEADTGVAEREDAGTVTEPAVGGGSILPAKPSPPRFNASSNISEFISASCRFDRAILRFNSSSARPASNDAFSAARLRTEPRRDSTAWASSVVTFDSSEAPSLPLRRPSSSSPDASSCFCC